MLTGGVELTVDQQAELRGLVNNPDVPATVGTRARIVLWHAEDRQKKEIAVLAGVSRPTVDLWLARYRSEGIVGLLERPRGAGREQVPAWVRARILAASRTSPPAQTGLSHWSSREMAGFITRTEGVSVSHHYVATLWRDNKIKPHRQGTFKLSKDPEFAEKVADIVGLYWIPRVVPWCSRSTRRPRSKLWTAPSRRCRSRSTPPSSAPMTMSGTASRTCSPR